MNISLVISAKKYIIVIIYLLIVFLLFHILNIIIANSLVKKFFSFEKCSSVFITLPIKKETNNYLYKLQTIAFPMLYNIKNEEEITNSLNEKKDNTIKEDKLENDLTIIKVEERNIEESYNYIYNDIKIKNQSNYNLSEDYFNLENIQFINKKIIIYHTHTCESYTPSEKYNYTMTGNYRTTNNDYNVVRLGEELKKILETEGFTVMHSTKYHDFPSYNGSYERSYETIETILEENPDTEIILDIHRDAVGNGSWYGPTICINGQSVAQMMFVVRYRWRRTLPSKLENKFQ